MYSIMFCGDATVYVDGLATEIVGHAHVYKDRLGETWFHFEDHARLTARVDIERIKSGRFVVTCHPPVAVPVDLVPSGLSGNWDRRIDDPVAWLVITNHCDEELDFLTIEGLEERVLCGERFTYLFFDERPDATAEVSLNAKAGTIDVCTSLPYLGVLGDTLSFEL